MKPVDTQPRCPACGYPRPTSACDRCHGRIVASPGGGSRRLAAPGPGFVLGDLAHGFVALFQGALSLFHRPEYVGKLWMPIAANVVALTAALCVFYFGLWSFFEWLIGTDWGWVEFLRGIATWLSWVLAMILAALTLFLLAPVIIEAVTSPFLDPIAHTTEVLLGGSDMRAIDQGLWQSTLVGLRGSAQILTIQIALWIPLLLLSLTGVGAVVALSISAFLNAVVWFDIPCARRGYGLRDRLRLIRRNWARAVGFGLAFQAGMFVPFFNVLFLTPAAAVATSRLYFHFEKVGPRGNVAPAPPPPTAS